MVFVAKDSGGVMNWKSFELSDKLFFRLLTDYKIDDQNGKDIQCTYDAVRDAYTEQVFNRYYNDTSSSLETMFFDQLGASNEANAKQIVYDLCGSAQDAMDQM